MYWTVWLWLAALLLRQAAADNERVYQDPDTKLSFYQTYQPYKLVAGKGVTFRFAVPDAPSSTAFDAVVQIVVPNEVGWAGLSWGGSMAQSPLLVVFRNANNQGVLASSRWSNGHTAPNAYTGATYTVFKTGTRVNSTHWQVTAKCVGCTSWNRSDGTKRLVNSKGDNRFAWAYALQKPTSPNSATSAIPLHEPAQYFSLDVGKAVNKDFATVVAKLT